MNQQSQQSPIVQLLRLINDGQYHSGENIATQMHISRTSVWKLVKKIRQLGLQITAFPKKGYRLTSSIQLLDGHAIQQQLSPQAQYEHNHIHVYPTIDSTNDQALRYIKTGQRQPIVVLAEQQTHGKGRLGKHWLSPFATNIYCTFVEWIQPTQANLSTLSLCASVAVADCLAPYLPPQSVKIKWPNDILCQQQKIAGILIETATEANHEIPVVIGVGINLSLPEPILELDQPITAIDQHSAEPINKNQIIASLINAMTVILQRYKKFGFTPIKPQWMHYHYLQNKAISLNYGQRKIHGIAHGLSDHGELMIQKSDGSYFFASYGTVHTLRPSSTQNTHASTNAANVAADTAADGK